MILWNPALTLEHYNNFNCLGRKLVPQLTCFEAGFEAAPVDRSDFLGFIVCQIRQETALFIDTP